MPPINQAALASAGVIAVSVAVAAAIAIYESPELQRVANDLRRRIAIALHSLGDGFLPENQSREPLFNRPEDAEGFLESAAEVDADDETRRRQREELMYWNAIKLSKELEKKTAEIEKEKAKLTGSTTFDDFLQEDKDADEKGTYVFNTGADVRNNDEGLVRRRGASEGVRGLNASLYANPFADEHGIDYDEQMDSSQISPEKDEVMSETEDIYNATPRNPLASSSRSRTLSAESLPALRPISPIAVISQPSHDTVSESDVLFESAPSEVELTETYQQQQARERIEPDPEQQEHTQEQENIPELVEEEEQGSQDVYASIQAWAHQQQSGLDFYSPLPVTPAAPLSEMSDGELVSEGQLTPMDSVSLAGSGEDIAGELASQTGSSKYYDVLSEDEDGLSTPARSWTEVGSVVSESEDGIRNAARS